MFSTKLFSWFSASDIFAPIVIQLVKRIRTGYYLSKYYRHFMLNIKFYCLNFLSCNDENIIGVYSNNIMVMRV
jgi:hypothetical protein